MGNNFGNWLNSQILEMGLNQSKFAKKAGLGRATLNKILGYSEKQNPTAETLTKIADGLNLPPEFVFRKAGILPAKHDLNPTLEEANRLLSELPEEYQGQALQLVRFLHDLHGPPYNAKGAKSTSK